MLNYYRILAGIGGRPVVLIGALVPRLSPPEEILGSLSRRRAVLVIIFLVAPLCLPIENYEAFPVFLIVAFAVTVSLVVMRRRGGALISMYRRAGMDAKRCL